MIVAMAMTPNGTPRPAPKARYLSGVWLSASGDELADEVGMADMKVVFEPNVSISAVGGEDVPGISAVVVCTPTMVMVVGIASDVISLC